MQKFIQRRSLLFCTLYFLFCALFFPYSVLASEVSIGVGAVEADGSRDIAVLIHSGAPVNALEGALLIPAGAEIIDITDASSPVQFWIERPHLSDTKDKITFAGIIPGGFSGEAALFHFHTKADPTKFTIDKSAMRILLNDGAGTTDPIKVTAERSLPAQFLLHNIGEDKVAPHPFTPERALLPTENGDAESLVFTAHDDESGVVRYEIAYSLVAIDPNDPTLVWESTNNPSLIQSTQSNKFIYVKAIDRAGNVRIAEVPPSLHTSGLLVHSILFFFAILSIVCAFVYGVWFFLGRRAKHVVHNDQSDTQK